VSFTARIDREAEKRLLARYSADNVLFILKEAARVGAQGGAKVMKAEAPVGESKRLSQYYRRMGLGHGSFRQSIRAALIRGRGSAIKGLQGKTVGYVIGPMGKNAFTRAWVEAGTKAHDQGRRNAGRAGREVQQGHGKGQHPGAEGRRWMGAVAGPALDTARAASEAVLDLYMNRTA
jgi:hypothetical protein